MTTGLVNTHIDRTFGNLATLAYADLIKPVTAVHMNKQSLKSYQKYLTFQIGDFSVKENFYTCRLIHV